MRAYPALIVLVAGCGGGSALDAAPACLEPPPEGAGDATYYDADGSGSCSFDPGRDPMVAAMNDPDYANAAWCGGCVEVTGPEGTVIVRIVDRCPGCASGDLDLSREAFAMIAPIEQGRVPITWRPVACRVGGPIEYRFKDGSNEWWTAIQIRNHRYPIARVAARDAAGAWNDIPREDYNYFVAASGLGPGPYALRVTDDRGHTLEDTGIGFVVALDIPGAAQFPVCP